MNQSTLPQGWDVVPLGELGRYINGRAFKPADWETSGLPIIRIQNLTNVEASFNYYSGSVEDKYYVHNGDLLISWSATLGAFIWDRGDAILNQHIFRVEVNDSRVDKLYLKYVVQSVLDELSKRTHGATMRHVTKGEFERFQVPVPRSLAEQRRIVARLEALLGEVRELRQLQAEIEADVGRLMEAVLAEVFGTEVVDNWPFEAALGDLVEINAPLVDPTLPEYRDLPHINGEVIEEGTGRLLPYRTAAEDGMRSTKYHFSPGSVLYSKIRPYLRKAVTVDFAGLCSADMYPLELKTDGVGIEFLKWALLSWHFTNYAVGESGRARMPKINRAELSAYRLRYPSVSEQDRISDLLERVQIEAYEMQDVETKNRRLFEELEQSILAQTFRGEL